LKIEVGQYVRDAYRHVFKVELVRDNLVEARINSMSEFVFFTIEFGKTWFIATENEVAKALLVGVKENGNVVL
jgi:hypothetical protein